MDVYAIPEHKEMGKPIYIATQEDTVVLYLYSDHISFCSKKLKERPQAHHEHYVLEHIALGNLNIEVQLLCTEAQRKSTIVSVREHFLYGAQWGGKQPGVREKNEELKIVQRMEGERFQATELFTASSLDSSGLGNVCQLSLWVHQQGLLILEAYSTVGTKA